MTRAVFFDVDFTLIHPGPTFRAEGYRTFCERYGIDVDVSAFERAVMSASPLLEPDDTLYDAEIFVSYVRHIIEQMGGRGDRLDACAREVYTEWATCSHFELYDDVKYALDGLSGAGVRVGLISNTHRSLDAFQTHFELDGLIAGAVSSFDHGKMKPHPSIFREALALLNVAAGEAVMVGDSVRQDVEGALGVGMGAVLLHRAGGLHPKERALTAAAVPIVQSLAQIPALVTSSLSGRPSQGAPTDEMQVDVKDRLPGVTIRVEHGSKSAS
jgi:putative hydrolase of the HAD superfamily